MSVTKGLSNAVKRSLSSLSSSLSSSSTSLSYSAPFSDISFATSRDNAIINDSLGYAKGLISTISTSSTASTSSYEVSYAYASPESDFNSLHAPSQLEPFKETTLSFSMPESDFSVQQVSSELLSQGKGVASILAYRTSINFASAYSDHVSPRDAEIAQSEDYAANAVKYDYASPESDFSRIQAPSFLSSLDHAKVTPLSFSSPESDFVSIHVPEKYNAVYPDTKLSYTSPESDFNAVNTVKAVYLDMLIPKTLQSALSSKKAVVVTECLPPFKITHVNEAWEGLCGFSANEAIGKTSRELLNGPLTQNHRLQSLTNEIKSSNLPSQITLTNYKKNGETFENRLTIAPFSINGVTSLTHLIAVLEPIGNNRSFV